MRMYFILIITYSKVNVAFDFEVRKLQAEKFFDWSMKA